MQPRRDVVSCMQEEIHSTTVCMPRDRVFERHETILCAQVLELQRRVQGTPHAAHLQVIPGDVMKVSSVRAS